MQATKEELNREIERKLKALAALRELKNDGVDTEMQIYELERQVDELVDQYADMKEV